MQKILIVIIFFLNFHLLAVHDLYEQSYAALTSNYNPEVTSKRTGYVHKRRCMRDYITVTGEDPLYTDGRTRDINLKVYTNRAWVPNDLTGKSKTIIIMAPMGGVTAIDNLYANYWCVFYPYKIILVKSWPGYISMELEAEAHDLQFRDAVSTIRHVIEYSKEQKVGIIGNSLGAVYSSFAAGVDERIKASIFIVGGADLPEVIGKSRVPRLVYLRNKRMKQFGFKARNEYIEYLRNVIKIDPIHFAHVLKEKSTYFISDIRDREVPTRNQFLLRDAIEPEEYSQFRLGHVGAVIWTSLWYRKAFATFFNKTIK